MANAKYTMTDAAAKRIATRLSDDDKLYKKNMTSVIRALNDENFGIGHSTYADLYDAWVDLGYDGLASWLARQGLNGYARAAEDLGSLHRSIGNLVIAALEDGPTHEVVADIIKEMGFAYE